MDDWILTVLLAVAVVVIGMLLIVAYVVAPVVGLLISNPIAGVGLLGILFILFVALFYKVTRD
jgi:hypothetical protein